MFRLNNLDAYVGLQAPISIDESIQPLVIVRGTIIAITNLVIDVPSGGESDGVKSVEEDVATYGNDG
jgi:hypothetical protein